MTKETLKNKIYEYGQVSASLELPEHYGEDCAEIRQRRSGLISEIEAALDAHYSELEPSDNLETYDTETLGKSVVETARKYKVGKTTSAVAHTASMLLLTLAYEVNAEEVTIDQGGCTYRGEDKGDWVITARRVKDPKPKRGKVPNAGN